MQRTKNWSKVAALVPVAALAFAAAATPAHANAVLTVSDGTNTLTLHDGDSCSGMPSGPGMISYCGPLGSWVLDFELALTEPALGTTGIPDMHLTTSALGQGTLAVTFTDDSFTGTGLKEFVAGIGGDLAAGASLTGGANYLAGGPPASIGTFNVPSGGSFDSTVSAFETPDGPYGLELYATLSQPDFGASSFDAHLAVPEPTTLALFGAGLLAAGIMVRGRRRVSDAA